MTRPLVLAGALALGLGAAGCAESTPAASPYADKFRTAIEETDSEYVKDVFTAALDKGTITADMYQESIQHRLQCYRDGGIDASTVNDDFGLGLVNFSFFADQLDDAGNAIVESCDLKWDGYYASSISSIYDEMVRNPERGDFDELTAACLVRKKLVEPGFDGAAFKEFLAKTAYTCADGVCTGPDGTTVSADDVPPSEPQYLPSGVSTADFEVRQCMVAPVADLAEK